MTRCCQQSNEAHRKESIISPDPLQMQGMCCFLLCATHLATQALSQLIHMRKTSSSHFTYEGLELHEVK